MCIRRMLNLTKPSIFIAATGQHVGKTTICLGVISGLIKRFGEVGFIKPVGQRHVPVSETLSVDKDVVLFKDHFRLSSEYNDMSPVLLPKGFTRDYLDGKYDESILEQNILESYNRILNENQYTIVEGTGHTGVGTIVNLNNARVASLLGLDMIIVASGGLGSSIDQLALNLIMCEKYNVKVRGIILNKVLQDKREMILEYFPKALKRWNVPLIGCVPYNQFLSNPNMEDFEALFKTSLLAGENFKYRHFQHSRFVATSADDYLNFMVPNQLIITHASRNDLILATITKHQRFSEMYPGKDLEGGLILTGQVPPEETVMTKAREAGIPTLYAPVSSYVAMEMITSFTAKIGKNDIKKVKKAVELVESHIDFEQLLDGMKCPS